MAEPPPPPQYKPESILDSVKKVIGLGFDYTAFDADIVLHINSTFATLHQLKVGPDTPYFITDRENLWTEFIEDKTGIDSVKTYVYAKVKLLFDPPPTSYGIASFERICSEFEWRLNVRAEGTY